MLPVELLLMIDGYTSSRRKFWKHYEMIDIT